MLIRKEKIIGLQVYDKKGRFVGTVKDIGFVLGENLVGIVVVGRDNREMEFIWSEVEAAEDIVILKKEVTIPSVTPVSKKPVEIHEEAKAVLKEQPVPGPAMPLEKPQIAGITSGTGIQMTPKNEIVEASELQASFREEPGYTVSEREEVESIGLQPGFETGKTEDEGSASKTKVCPKCGAINNARYKFCFRCGTRLPP